MAQRSRRSSAKKKNRVVQRAVPPPNAPLNRPNPPAPGFRRMHQGASPVGHGKTKQRSPRPKQGTTPVSQKQGTTPVSQKPPVGQGHTGSPTKTPSFLPPGTSMKEALGVMRSRSSGAPRPAPAPAQPMPTTAPGSRMKQADGGFRGAPRTTAPGSGGRYKAAQAIKAFSAVKRRRG